MTADELRALLGLLADGRAEAAIDQLLAAGQPLATLAIAWRYAGPSGQCSWAVGAVKAVDDGIAAGELDPLVAGAFVYRMMGLTHEVLCRDIPAASQLWKGIPVLPCVFEAGRALLTDPQAATAWPSTRYPWWRPDFDGGETMLELTIHMPHWLSDAKRRQRVLAADVLGYPYLLAAVIQMGTDFYGRNHPEWKIEEPQIVEFAGALARAPGSPTMHTWVLPEIIV